MNIKKLLLSAFVVLVFCVIFLLCFQHCAKAEEVLIPTEDTTEGSLSSNEANDEQETPTEGGDEVEAFNLYEYIKEKIIPVVVGVLTSVSALLATLVAVKRGLNSLSETKDSFKKEAKERAESFKKESEYLNSRVEEMEKSLAVVPQLRAELSSLEKSTQRLVKESLYLGRMISLGFSQSKEVVSSGNGKKISRLLEECERLNVGEAKEE